MWRLVGNVRGEGASILLRLWDALGWPEQVSADTGVVTRYGVCLCNFQRLQRPDLFTLGIPNGNE